MPERKPLELVVYPASDGSHDAHSADCLDCRLDRIGDSKRLTDSELAAEYHAMDALLFGAPGSALWSVTVRRLVQLQTLHRFATLPHYDEGNPDA